MIDLVTVVFQEELPILKLQAKSIDRYCQYANIGKIYVIVNDPTLDTSEINIDWWGSMKNRVVIVHRSTWPVTYVENGWLTQQLLKLLATGLSNNKWSMILDAKTIFVNPVLEHGDKPQVGMLDIYPVFEPSRQIVNKLFGIDLQKQLGPGGVPFIMHNQTTVEMIKQIESLTNQSFPSWFQEQGMLTEFILYSGYVISKYNTFSTLYTLDDPIIKPCNLCHSEVESFNRKFKEMSQSTTVSIHRNAWTHLTTDQQQQYLEFLRNRGIE